MNGHLGAVKYLVKDISLSVNDSNEVERPVSIVAEIWYCYDTINDLHVISNVG